MWFARYLWVELIPGLSCRWNWNLNWMMGHRLVEVADQGLLVALRMMLADGLILDCCCSVLFPVSSECYLL